MTADNELVLIVCPDSTSAGEQGHRFQCRDDLRIHLQPNDDLGVALEEHATPETVVMIRATMGAWRVEPVGDCTTFLNRAPLESPARLHGGDILTWTETSAFVACHPQQDPPERRPSESGPVASQSALWLDVLRSGGSRTAEFQLFERYYPRVVDVARACLHNARLRSFDEDDVAAEAFSEFYNGLTRGKFSELKSRSELWAMLVCITRRRAIDKLRHARAAQRAPEQLRGESVFQFNTIGEISFGRGVGKNDAMDDIAVFEGTEEVDHFIRFLEAYDSDRQLHLIAAARLDGKSNPEIAESLGISLRAVERGASRIRVLWEQHAARNPKG